MSEFHPPGPFGPKDMSDPGFWQEQRELEEERRRKGGTTGGGIFGLAALPMLVPLVIMVGTVLYPLTALATGAAWFVGHTISQMLGLKDLPMYAVTFAPALVVLFISLRWDTWFAENFVYWLVRHIARNILFIVMMIILANVDFAKNHSDTAILTHFFNDHEQLGVTAVFLAVFNYITIGEGVVKTFWHAALEIAWLRPAGLSK